MKKLLFSALMLMLSFLLCACTIVNCTQHIDANDDLACDKCSAKMQCTEHKDTDGNLICDKCQKALTCTNHTDENNDGECDKCAWDYDHTHTYSSEWLYDETNHWRAPACSHDIAPKDKGAHVDNNNNAKCDICEAVLCTNHVDNNHDGKCDTAACGKTGLTVTHTDENNDGVCDGCNWDYDHTHTYSSEWLYDETKHWRAPICSHDIEPKDSGAHVDNNNNAKCDICEVVLCTNHMDNNHDGSCDHAICNYAVTVVHTDANHDGKCDTPTCTQTVAVNHTDANHDGKCDVTPCAKTGLTVEHVDANNDCKCDVATCANKNLQHKDANSDNTCDVCEAALGGGVHECVDEDPYDGYCDICDEKIVVESCEHIDEAPRNGYCDKCDEEILHECIDKYNEGTCYICGKAVNKQEEVINYPWDSQTLNFQLTENTNEQQIVSVSRKYLAGEISSTSDSVATAVANRNAAAEYATGIEINYLFWSDDAAYGWGACIEKIQLANQSGGASMPDVHINFVYDMVGASLKQSFANLRSTYRGSGDTKGLNYFSFLKDGYDESVDDKGYMFEYMSSLTLAPDTKMYVLSSDYFIDMVRAFFIIPVSLKLLQDYGADIVAEGTDGTVYEGGDRDGDGDFDVDDFYAMVKAGEWTYDTLAKFSDAVYSPSSGSDGSVWLGDERVGFAMSISEISASGLLYTTNVEIINKTKNADGSYTYTYPQDNQPFYAFCDATSVLFQKPGVCTVSEKYSDFGTTAVLAIRERFTKNHVLFGDIMLLGALEFKAYQDMRATEDSGFGVVPVPLFNTDYQTEYLTQISSYGCCGAISAMTTKFAECTAFLDYQSRNSKDILDAYYKYNIEYALSGDSEGTRDMLRYIRNHVRSSFDKAMEDALGVYDPTADKWHNILMEHKFIVDIRTEYSQKYQVKQTVLNNLKNAYAGYPD